MLLKPWYDAYGAPYKDRYRSWTGILLLIRCILGLAVGSTNNTTVSLAVLSYTCLLLSSFVLSFPIYKHAYLNLLELFTFVSLLTMSTLSVSSHTNIRYTYSVVIIFNLVFFIFIIVIYHIYLKLMQYRCSWSRCKAFKASYALKLTKQRKMEDKDKEDKDLDDKEKTASVPTTTVSLDSISLREPQLEESSFYQ